MIKIFSSALLFSIILCSLADNTVAQNDQNIPLPEFYGIYALIDGKVCGVTVPTAGCSLKLVDAVSGDQNIKAIEYKKGLRFLVYQESPSAFVSKLRLQPMLFLRNEKSIDMFPPYK